MLFNIEVTIHFIVILLGLFFIYNLNKTDKRNNLSNEYLSIFVIANIILIFRGLRWTINPHFSGHRLFHFLDASIFFYGVYLFAYIKQLTTKARFHIPKIHFLPVALFIAFNLVIACLSLEVYWSRIDSFLVVYVINEGISLVLCFTYLILSFSHFRKYILDEKKQLSYVQNTSKYIYAFLWSILLFLLIWAVSYVGDRIMQIGLDKSIYIALGIALLSSVCVIAYYKLRFPELFQLEELKSAQRLSKSQVGELKSKIDALMSNQKTYLEPRLNLMDFSQKLDTSPHDISWFLNNILNKSFYDFINAYRIKEFIQKLEQGQHHTHTLLTLSIEAGFNSKSTFNKAFKEQTQQTPREYIKKKAL